MEKLDLYSEELEENSNIPAVEPIRFKTRIARLPRLLKAADLVDDEGEEDELAGLKRRGIARMPRLVVTADTPRKFFKSKTGSEESAAATAATATPVAKSMQKATRGKTATDEAISIYTDVGADEGVQTPQPLRSQSGSRAAPGTAAKRTGRSTRKKNEETTSLPGTGSFESHAI